jgi:hypothetical protein
VTLIVGFNLGSYALLGADTRVSWYPKDDDRLHFRDDMQKLQRIEMGLITGAGLVDLLEPVKERLDSSEVVHTDTIIEAAKAEVEIVKRRPWATKPRVAQSIAQTAWMFTYVTADNVDNPTLESARLRLAFTVPDEGYQLAQIPANACWLLAPTGTTEAQFTAWRKFCQDNLKPLENAADVVTNAAHQIGVIGAVMKRVSGVNDGVAETFQIGLHIFPGTTMVSTIIGPDMEIEWESTDELENT